MFIAIRKEHANDNEYPNATIGLLESKLYPPIHATLAKKRQREKKVRYLSFEELILSVHYGAGEEQLQELSQEFSFGSSQIFPSNV